MKIILKFEESNFWHIVFSLLGLGVSSLEQERETKKKCLRISICQEFSSKSLRGRGKARKKEEGSKAPFERASQEKRNQSYWFFLLSPPAWYDTHG